MEEREEFDTNSKLTDVHSAGVNGNLREGTPIDLTKQWDEAKAAFQIT